MGRLRAPTLLLACVPGLAGLVGWSGLPPRAAWAGEAAEAGAAVAPTTGSAILGADLRAHLEILASDAYEGRLTTEAGGRKAAAYVAASLERSGLTPLGQDGGWFQPYVVPVPVLGEGNRLRGLRGESRLELEVTVDWNPVSVTASAAAEGDLVFAGFGISAPKAGRDDYADLDVKGKVVLVLRRAPTQELARFAALLSKVATATEKGAAGILVVNDATTVKEGGDELLAWNAHVGGAVGSAKIPFGFVTRAAAQRLLALGGADLEALEAQARQGPAGAAVEGARVALTTAMARSTQANARNVAGFLKGRDPDLADEVVILGAHHDHVGRGGPGSLGGAGAQGQVHNGADDNGSGTVALLELAAWFADPAHRPRRSLLFLSFSGEELGLLGSEHYAAHPIVPLADTVAMVNLDMIGRCSKGSVEVGGVGTGTGLKELVQAANLPYGFSLRLDPQGEAPTDSTSFFRRKVPVLWLFTGLHDDYHRPSDDCDRICWDDLERITRLTADILAGLAENDARPTYTDPPKVRRRAVLGVQPAPEPHPRGVRLAGVAADGPAGAAGIHDGDVLLSVGGQTVRSLKDLQEVLRKLEPGKPVTVVVLRDAAEVTVTVTLGEGG